MKKYFAPDYREPQKVVIYEKSPIYSSGYVMVGAMSLSAAMNIYTDWAWLTPENVIKAEKNFEGESWSSGYSYLDHTKQF
jgi:hypothetical protein